MTPTRSATFITADLVRSIQPSTDKEYEIVWDARVPDVPFANGFGLRTTDGGTKAFLLDYRINGIQRRVTIGKWPRWTVERARAKALEWCTMIDNGRDPKAEKLTKRAKIKAERERERTELTVRELAAKFDADYIATRVRPRTAEGYRSQLKCHVLSSKIADLPISQVTAADIIALHADATKIAPQQANRTLSLLHRMFNIAKAWKLVPPDFVNPAKTAPRGTVDGVVRNAEHPRERYPLPEEMAAIRNALDAHPNQRVANAVRVLVLTGCRRNEALSMRWDDLVFGERPMWNRPAISMKGKKNNSIPLAPQAAELLLGIRNQQVADGTFKPGGFVFPSSTSHSGHLSSIKKFWKQILRDAGIEGLVLHSLRHGFASTLISAGFDLPVVGRLLAHSSPSITARYAHLADDVAKQAVDAVADIFSAAKPAKTASVARISGRRR
jgi:integrase